MSNVLPPPTGTRAEQGAELIRRCDAREKHLLELALEAERASDTEGTWFAMAARAENNRLKARVMADLATEAKLSNPTTGTLTK